MKYSEVYWSLAHLHEKQPTHLVARKIDELMELGLAHYIPEEEHETNLALAEEYVDLMKEERRLVDRRGSVDFELYGIKKQHSSLWYWLWTKREVLEDEHDGMQKLSEEKEELDKGIDGARKKIIEVVKIFDKYDPWRQPYVRGSGVVFYSDGTYPWFDKDSRTTAGAPYDPIPSFDPRKFVSRFFRLGKKKGYAAPSGLGTYLLEEAERKKNGFASIDPRVRWHIKRAIKDDLEFSWEHFYQPEIRLQWGEEHFRRLCTPPEGGMWEPWAFYKIIKDYRKGLEMI